MMFKPIWALLLISPSVLAVETATEARLDEVARRGAQVMPFDLEQTQHIFSKTEQGGVQQVIVKDRSDAEQIELIRDHLSKISGEFARGDFSGPAKIHGEDMPGLAELKKARPGQIEVEYQELTNGAQIEYTANDSNGVDAIHRWFDAQLSDHARHAKSGHTHHHGQ
ncbi:MAG: aspartate carbamoyltransferase [Methylococcaceae bacterium]|nr:aspartate carbamoyltransferase [Methylococcaceae bacterium]